MDQIRRRRLEELIREEISRMLALGEIKDPRVNSFLSITRVEAAQDGSHARVWVSSLEDEEARLDEAIAGLSHAAGFIQALIAKRVRLRLTPVLTFVPDRGIKEAFEVTEKLKDLLK
ncbi:MAG: 30S ribosome-binding factor RbfA [Rectinema sp.]|jgi:ribosome-binding factor A|uniref:Ribosome-binding factor A n=1 Tax=uncultured spirochete TaxID=156406 RepID=A0A3P3XUJ8_9SPIR|nr:Ribosome-binding factor A [uncultured spirochete]